MHIRRQQYCVYYLMLIAALLALYPFRIIWGEVNLPPLLGAMRCLIAGLYIQWAFVYFKLGDIEKGSEYPAYLLPILIVFGFLFSAFYPMFSGDVFDYLMKGRILSIYHQNPYGHVPNEYSQDLMHSLSTWKYTTEVYGPVAVWAQSIPPLLAANSQRGMLVIYKLISISCWAGSILLFQNIAKSNQLKNDQNLTILFALNPLLFVSVVMDGHNEALLIFFLLLAVHYLLLNKPVQFGLCFAFSLMVKYPVLISLPYLLIFLFKAFPDEQTKSRIKKVTLAVLTIVVTTFLGYAPFMRGTHILQQLQMHTGNAFYSNSIPYALQEICSRFGLFLSDQFCSMVFIGLFAAFFFYGMIKLILSSKLTWEQTSFWIFILYLFGLCQTTAPLQFWYLLWGLIWLIYAQWPHKHGLITLYSFAGLFSYSKRMNYLMLAALAIYMIMLMTSLTKKRLSIA